MLRRFWYAFRGLNGWVQGITALSLAVLVAAVAITLPGMLSETPDPEVAASPFPSLSPSPSPTPSPSPSPSPSPEPPPPPPPPPSPPPPPPPPPSPLPPPPPAPTLLAFHKFGTWVDVFDYTSSTPKTEVDRMVDDMKSKAVRTLYLQTSRYSKEGDILNPDQVGWFLDRAHAHGIYVIGWYLPAYCDHLQKDIRRTVAIAQFRSSRGEAFNGLGVDIEYKGECGGDLQRWNSGIAQHLTAVRSAVGGSYPIGAIVPSPVAMSFYPPAWEGFPWGTISQRSNVVLPMAYWSYRKNCEATPQRCCQNNPDFCAYTYIRNNISESRRLTGLPVHVIGGVANNITTQEVADFVRAAREMKAYGGSLYDYRTTQGPYWGHLAGLNNL